MRVLLVNPGQTLAPEANNPAVIDKQRGKNPPLGILYVAAAIRGAGRHDVTVIDLNLGDMALDGFKTHIKEAGYDVLGVTITTFTLIDALAVMRAFKEARRGGKVIAGGPHVAVYPRETVGLGADVAVKREGEPVINGILDRIAEPNRLRDVAGICFRLGEEIIDTGDAPFVESLDSLAMPDRMLLPYQKYYSLLGQESYSTTMITSRGCPFGCTFCDRPALGKRFRYHSSKYVMEEIRTCMNLGIHEFLIYDDTFTVNRKRVLDICEGIRKGGLSIRWDIRTRVDTVDEEMLRALKSAGCCAVHYGVESGSPRILQRLNKGISLQRVREVFRLTKIIGMNTLAYFMVGNPGETQEDIQESIQLISQLDPDYLHLTIFSPFPGTALYREALAKGIIADDVYRRFAAAPTTDFTPPIWQENFTRAQLQDIVRRVYRTFYLRPAYMWRSLFRLRSLPELKRKLRAGMGVLRMKG